MEAATAQMTVVDRFQLKAFAEAVLVVDEGVTATKDVELGMMMGAGILPGPLTRADEAGLDAMLERLELAEREWGDGFAPPLLLRRLVNQGRLGRKTGQGFFFYPRPDEGAEQKETVLLETRDELAILWLNRPPTNPISPQVIRDLTALWDEIESRDEIRAAVVASSNFAVFCAGADIKEFTKMTDPAAGKELLDSGHGVLRRMEQSSKVTIAAVNSLALGGGCELAMACDFRIAAESASFGQPEINLGIIPGFGGTQRLARLVGEAKALEMNLLGEPISARAGLRAGPRQRGRPRPRAVRRRARLGAQAGRPGAGGRRADQEGLGEGRPGRGDRGGEGRLRHRVRLRGRARGDLGLPRQAQAEVVREVGLSTGRERLARAASARASSTVALTGAGISVPSGIPDFRTPGRGLWEKVDPMSVATIDAFHRDTEAASGTSTGPASTCSPTSSRTPPTRPWRSSSGAGCWRR